MDSPSILDSSLMDEEEITFTGAYNSNAKQAIEQAIDYEKPLKSSLFGNGNNPKFLHPSSITYNADFAIEIGEKVILLHKNILIERVPYFNTFGEDSDFVERNTKIDITEEVTNKTVTVYKIHLKDCVFDPELVCEYFSFIYKEKVIFSDRIFQLYEISDFFCDEKVSRILLSQVQINSDNLAFAWKQVALKDAAMAYILRETVVDFYTTEHVNGGWKNLSSFYHHTMTMNAIDLVEFIGELKKNKKIADNMYTYFVIAWVDKNSEQADVSVKVSEILANDEVYGNVDKSIKEDIYAFLVSTDGMEKDAMNTVHKNLFGQPVLENSQKRKTIFDKILKDKPHDNKKPKDSNVKIEANPPEIVIRNTLPEFEINQALPVHFQWRNPRIEMNPRVVEIGRENSPDRQRNQLEEKRRHERVRQEERKARYEKTKKQLFTNLTRINEKMETMIAKIRRYQEANDTDIHSDHRADMLFDEVAHLKNIIRVFRKQHQDRDNTRIFDCDNLEQKVHNYIDNFYDLDIKFENLMRDRKYPPRIEHSKQLTNSEPLRKRTLLKRKLNEKTDGHQKVRKNSEITTFFPSDSE